MTDLFKKLVNDFTFSEYEDQEQEEKLREDPSGDQDLYPVIRRGKIIRYERL